MIQNKKLIIALVLVVLVAVGIAYLLTRDDRQALKPGDRDPDTGCVIASDGRGSLCDQ